MDKTRMHRPMDAGWVPLLEGVYMDKDGGRSSIIIMGEWEDNGDNFYIVEDNDEDMFATLGEIPFDIGDSIAELNTFKFEYEVAHDAHMNQKVLEAYHVVTWLDGAPAWKCKNCKQIYFNEDDKPYEYCPHCGAKSIHVLYPADEETE